MQFLGTSSVGPGQGWTNSNKTWTSVTTLSDTADTITGSIFSDQAGTLTVSQSGDGTNFDITDTVSVSASTGAKINVVILNPYIQVSFVASTTAPGTFRLFARFGSAGVKP